MFGRTLNSLTNKTLNPILKSIDRAVVGTSINNVPSHVKAQSIANGQSYGVNYSSSSKSFTMAEKKIEEIKVPHKPTSPHVLIYRFPLPAIMSIMHRVTGVSLALGIGAICFTALFAPHDVTYYIDMIKNDYPLIVYPARFCIAFPLVYHASTGVRHLIWDSTLKGITTPQAESTCKIILGVVAAATFFFTFYSL